MPEFARARMHGASAAGGSFAVTRMHVGSAPFRTACAHACSFRHAWLHASLFEAPFSTTRPKSCALHDCSKMLRCTCCLALG